MRPSRVLRLLLGAALAGGLLAGCGDEDDRVDGVGALTDLSALYPPPSPRLAPVLTLDGTPATTDDGGGVSSAPGNTSVSEDGIAVVGTDRGATAYDANTHVELWSTDLSGADVCRVSPVVDGQVAVLTGERSGGACGAVAVLDVRSGVERWRRDLGDVSLMDVGTVALGLRSVYAGSECGSVLRFDAETGRRGTPLLAPDGVCGDSNAMTGDVIALWEDPESPDTPDEVSPGWIPPYDGAGRLRVVDAGLGEQVWARTLDRDGADVRGVVSTDPLVLDVTEDGHRTMQRYDADGQLEGYLGGRLGPSDGFTPVVVDRGVLVGSYEDVPGYYAYALAGGQELWRVTDDRWLAGVDPLGLVWTQPGRVSEDGTVETEGQVVRTTVGDPTDGELLGALPGPGTGALVIGNDLLLPGRNRTLVLPLPLSTSLGPAPAPYDPVGSLVEWRPDDVRPEETLDYCDAVEEADVAAVGLRTDLPAPVDCWWHEWEDPSYLEKDLEVGVSVSSPGPSADGEPTAAEVAANTFTQTHRRWAPLPGLGDEARSRSNQSADGRRSSAAVDVLAGNLVVTVEASVAALVPETTDRAVPAARLEQVVRDVAADVLASLDLPVDPEALPEAGEPGPVAEAPDVCRAVGDVGVEVAGPLARRTDRSPEDPALSSCRWGLSTDEPGTSLDVVAFAVPPGVLPDADGEVPPALAVAEGLRLWGRPFRAVGPDARMRGSGEPAEYVSRTLSVRRGNLVVVVDGSAFAGPLPSGADLESDLVRVARRVLDATRR